MKRFAALFLVFLLATGCASDSTIKMFYDNQLAAIQAQKPIFRIEGIPGQPIVMSGVSKIEAYMPSGAGNIPQFVDPWAGVVKEGITGAAMLGGIYLGGQAAIGLVGEVGKVAGHNWTGAPGMNYQTVGQGALTSPNAGIGIADHTGTATGAPSNAPVTTTTGGE